MLILAGDVGGTTTRLAYFQGRGDALEVLAEEHYRSREHASLADIVRTFTLAYPMTAGRACFGVAGPVQDGQVDTPNLPWHVDSGVLAGLLKLPEVRLINDLEANTYGIALLKPGELASLNAGVADPVGTIAVLSAGTGLGASFAYWDGNAHRPLASEAGHADFAPRNALEIDLLLYLQGKYGRVSYERVVSGPGLLDCYLFLKERRGFTECPEVSAAMEGQDKPAVITRAALADSCPLCSKALDMLVTVYGAESGNAALRFFATGGVFLGGGIAPHILEKLRGESFRLAFADKGRLGSLVGKIPVQVILNERTALLGAGRAASLLPH